MIHYHGTPVTPMSVKQFVLTGRHAFISFEDPRDVAFAAEVCQSFALDNGAFSKWKRGGHVDLPAYAAWVNEWRRHPGFDFAVIPDVIDGTEEENDAMFGQYRAAGGDLLADVPVWHINESYERLARLCRTWPRVALGSAGEWREVGTAAWWQRMGGAMDFVCDAAGRPPAKLHGLRMLNPTVFSQLPLSSADSTNVARNHKRDFYELSDGDHAATLLHRIERHASAPRWTRTYGTQMNMDLVG